MRRIFPMFLLLALCAAPAHAGPLWPDLSLDLGGTTAVSGTPNSGGFSAALSAMWPDDGPLALGLTVFADDMGAKLGQYTTGVLIPRGGSAGQDTTVLVPNGTYESVHRFIYGAAWRLDAAFPPSRSWRPFATATWGYGRVQDDARGLIASAESATRFGIGAGLRRDVLHSSTLGVAVRYQRLADDRVHEYVSAALEWGWRFEKTQ